MRRKVYEKLMEWKNSPERKSLLISGARQIGKTYIVDKFIKDNYKSYIYLNFSSDDTLKNIFDGSLMVDDIILKLSSRFKNEKLEEYDICIFLDEIQLCANARTALKFFTMDKRYDVIASGSLLGINYKDVVSMPVGYVENIEMHSFDFEEFLWAIGVSEEIIESVKKCYQEKIEVPLSIHEDFIKYFKQYIVVGGMPECIKEFVKKNNISNVVKVQKDILKAYETDIAKYAERQEKVKARECFYSIPKHLSQDYKKFKYSLVEKKGTSRKFSGSLMWLYDAGYINYCYNLDKIESPLKAYASDNNFKVYMRDTGLLMAMLDGDAQSEILMGSMNIYKGAIYENIIADIFKKREEPLYYYEKNSKMEIDFIIKRDGDIVPIEVKSGDNLRSKSINFLIEKNVVKKGIKLSLKNRGTYNKSIISVPIYMAMWI